ncbi:uncharacterized protein F5147DRAFT_41105 [Suillus discolor]|uniref:Uncharacterized protein n=1 Tax=Suillus discolor TaxID=1912936 RepID=A0A9P7JML7_9AGAM|nr:uncharacterized protein F5147DRAFT_41105 [Suillus discolor]KAG2089332.1 hypothetical protein F5147DRAFT_41105 [Suillus discolor]
MPVTTLQLDHIIHDLGLVKERATAQDSKIEAANRELDENKVVKQEVNILREENKVLKQDVVLQKKNNELEEEIKELKEDVKTNCTNILKLERRTLVNEARDKLRDEFSFTQDQLNPFKYPGEPGEKLKAAAKFVLSHLPPTEKPKLSLNAVKTILNKSQNSVRELGNKLAHTDVTIAALEDQNLQDSQRNSFGSGCMILTRTYVPLLEQSLRLYLPPPRSSSPQLLPAEESRVRAARRAHINRYLTAGIVMPRTLTNLNEQSPEDVECTKAIFMQRYVLLLAFTHVSSRPACRV